MNLSKLVAVSGMPGVFRMVSNRSNGLIVENMDSGKKRFVASRKHQFTPLETISIYTEDDDTAELKDVFATIKENMESIPLITSAASSEEARVYFKKILPNYDRDRVYVSDIKKIAKWFTYLNDRNLLEATEEEAEPVEEKETTDK